MQRVPSFILHPRARWAVPVSLVALLIALAVHALFLFGLRLKPLSGPSRAMRPALLWLTRARPEDDARTARSRRRIPARLQRVAAPSLPTTRRIAEAVLLQPVPQRAPLSVLAPTVAPTSRDVAPAALPGRARRRQWRLQIARGTEYVLLESWTPASWSLGERSYAPVRPAVFDLTLVLPSGYRSVTLAQSSGDARFDADARAQVQRLPVRTDAAAVTPDRSERIGYRRVRVVATIDAAGAP